MRKKAKVDWLTTTYESSQFFYAKTSNKGHKNDIGKLVDKIGVVIMKLLKQSLKPFIISTLYIIQTLLNKIPNIDTKCLLHPNSQEILLASVNIKEKGTIFNANNDKSPDPDGFGA